MTITEAILIIAAKFLGALTGSCLALGMAYYIIARREKRS